MLPSSAPFDLTDHFLIAMPGLEDKAFGRSVVYLCEHGERGALGLIINKPSADLTLSGLFAKVDLPLDRTDLQKVPVFDGGPVQTGRGFVLHEAIIVERAGGDLGENSPQESVYQSTMTIPGGLEMTTSKDVLEAISSGSGPKKLFITLGYSQWAQGQLESELAENTWLTVQADPEVIFNTPIKERYAKALSLLGLQEWMISRQSGRA